MKLIPYILMPVLMLAANYYVFYRLWHLMPPNTAGRILLIAIAAVTLGSIFTYALFIGGNPPYWLGAATYKIGTSWIMIMLYMLIAFLLMELVRVTGLVNMEWMKTGSWAAFGTFAAAMAVIFVIGNIAYNDKSRVELDIALDKELNEGRPLKIVAVSDLHLGYGIGPGEFTRWTELINREEPDLVLIAGDAIDSHLKPLYDKNMGEIFHRIKSRYGIYAIPGNHEYISGIDRSAEFYETAGVTLLRDSVADIGGMLYIAGRDDATNTSRLSVGALSAPLDRSKPVILLDHQPYNLSEAHDSGIDLQISGHTHRGQVWPISWITDAIFEKSHGYLHKPATGATPQPAKSRGRTSAEQIAANKGGTHYFISSGLGIWGGKFRIGSKSEYIVINLKGY